MRDSDTDLDWKIGVGYAVGMCVLVIASAHLIDAFAKALGF